MPNPRAAPSHDPAARAPDDLPAGTILGPWRIEKRLARGASATLYLAHAQASPVPMALKVLCPTGDDLPSQRERFLREAEHVSALDHPNIVRIHGGGQANGIAFLGMDFLPGSNLTRWTRPGHLLPETVTLEIAAQLADALAHAHRQGIVHRDVKPANAIFDPARRHVTLTDFGIARAPDAQASRSGVLMGSPVYMAPELLAGQSASASSDLYALGVLSYELLAGRAPFEAASMGALLRAVARTPPPPLATLRPDWPQPMAAQLDRWFETLLAKDPAQRPADGQAWAAAARELARGLAGG